MSITASDAAATPDSGLERRYREAGNSAAFSALCRYAQGRPAQAFDMMTGTQIAMLARRIGLFRYRRPEARMVLDLCCGSGLSAVEAIGANGVASRDLAVFGCDLSPAAVSLAASRNPSHQYHVADAANPAAVVAAADKKASGLSASIAGHIPVLALLLDGPEGVEHIQRIVAGWHDVLPAGSHICVCATVFADDGPVDQRFMRNARLPGLPEAGHKEDLTGEEQQVWHRLYAATSVADGGRGSSRRGATHGERRGATRGERRAGPSGLRAALEAEGLGWLADEIALSAEGMQGLRAGTDYRRWYLEWETGRPR